MKYSLSISNNTYDSLAQEYENRVEEYRPITEKAVSLFTPYIKTGKKVLDIGCGVGLALEIFKQKGFSITGMDISRRMIKFARKRNKNGKFILGNFLSLDVGRQLFDGVYMSGFLHLFPKEKAVNVLKRTYRILKPKGILFIGTTKSMISKEGMEIKSNYPGKLQRFRKYWTEKELKNFIIENRFKIIKIYHLKGLFRKTWMDFIVQKAVL